MATLGDLVSRFEATTFTGRHRELDVFVGWLEEADPRLRVLNVTGHGGLGKTALLRAYRREATDADSGRAWSTAAIWRTSRGRCTASSVGPRSPRGGRSRPDDRRCCSSTGSTGCRPCGPTSPRRSSPRSTAVCGSSLATRRPFLGSFGVDHPLRAVCEVLPLSPLRPADVADYLDRRGLDDPVLRRRIEELTAGNPLALSMAADLQHELLVDAPDRPGGGGWGRALRLLTDRLLADTSPALRDVLAAAAVVRQFDEDLLSEVAGVDVRPHAATLARLAVVRPGEHGLCLHDDVRRLLRDTLRSTLPDRYATMRSRALACYRRRMADAPPEVRERLVNEQLYLWDDEVVGPALFPGDDGDRLSVRADPPRIGRRSSPCGTPRARSSTPSRGAPRTVTSAATSCSGSWTPPPNA